jgi:phage shock protein A
MGVGKRVSLVYKAKANKALDRMEDPRETLDYSYQEQLELLRKADRGVADVATSRKRVELQMNQLQLQANKLQDQARKALGMGREDLAQEALTRKSSAQGQLNDLQAQYAQLQAEEEKLTAAAQRLQAKVEAFRTRKETIKATYTAAEAQTRINEAFSGISEEMGDVGMAIQRAEDKTAQMQARAGAIDELMASDALDDPIGGRRDEIQSELNMIAASSNVEREPRKPESGLGEIMPGHGGDLQPGDELPQDQAAIKEGPVGHGSAETNPNGDTRPVGFRDRALIALRPFFVPTVSSTAVLDALKTSDPAAAVEQLFNWERDRLLTLSKGLGAAGISLLVALIGLIATGIAQRVAIYPVIFYLSVSLVAILPIWAGFLLAGLHRLAEEYPKALDLVGR